MIKRRKPGRGLDSAIGGYMTTIHTRVRWSVKKFLKREERRKERLSKKMRVREMARELLISLFPFVFCTTCGSKIERGENSPEKFSLIRKCEGCLMAKISSPAIKYCRHCRKVFRKEDFSTRTWSTIAVCPECKKVKETLVKELKRQAHMDA